MLEHWDFVERDIRNQDVEILRKLGLFIVCIDHRNYPGRGEAGVVQGSVKHLCSVVSVVVPVPVKTRLVSNSFNITAMEATQMNNCVCVVILLRWCVYWYWYIP